MKLNRACLLPALLALAAVAQPPQSHTKPTPLYGFQVVHQFPHDPNAYTQGLAYGSGFFYEGTGRNRQSSLRQVRIETGEVLRRIDLPAEYFGEGVALFGKEIIELTWLSHAGFVYDIGDFHRLRQFSFAGEGWGLASDAHQLYMSDGTSEIRVLDPATLQEKRRIQVHDGANAITQLNELEVVEGELFANVWHTDRIARISLQTGQVVGWIDLSGLLSSVYRLEPEAVLNGIAYDSQRKRLFVTGKLWPTVFEIKLIPK